MQDCRLHFMVSDLEGRICNSTAFPLHTMGWLHYWLMDRTAPYKLPAATSIDLGFGTRPNLNLWIEVNVNASKETTERKEVWQRNGKGHQRKWMGKENKGKSGLEREACKEISICLKGRRWRLEKLVWGQNWLYWNKWRLLMNGGRERAVSGNRIQNPGSFVSRGGIGENKLFWVQIAEG